MVFLNDVGYQSEKSRDGKKVLCFEVGGQRNSGIVP
jgi:hypothetical protein